MTDRPLFPTRRATLAGIAGLTAGAILARPSLADMADAARKLKPGQYTWQPELQPRGPVSIIVSIKEQLLHVHRKGKQIGVSTVSTGKSGHATPIGVFTILEKNEEHVSSIYDSEMPFMQRLTWSGIALHAGALPGYPASHGCVRLPIKFAELLFSATKLGTPVVIANRFTDPNPVVSSAIAGRRFARSDLGGGFAARTRAYQDGEPEPRPVTSVLVSRQDSHVIVLENGAIVAEGKATITDPETPFPSEVFVLNGAAADGDGLSWEAIGYGDGDEAPTLPGTAVMDRIHGPDNVAAAIAARLAPGMILIVTDGPLAADTRSADDFVVMTAEDAEK